MLRTYSRQEEDDRAPPSPLQQDVIDDDEGSQQFEPFHQARLAESHFDAPMVDIDGIDDALRHTDAMAGVEYVSCASGMPVADIDDDIIDSLGEVRVDEKDEMDALDESMSDLEDLDSFGELMVTGNMATASGQLGADLEDMSMLDAYMDDEVMAIDEIDHMEDVRHDQRF